VPPLNVNTAKFFYMDAPFSFKLLRLNPLMKEELIHPRNDKNNSGCQPFPISRQSPKVRTCDRLRDLQSL
jgi:hypothetical protein